MRPPMKTGASAILSFVMLVIQGCASPDPAAEVSAEIEQRLIWVGDTRLRYDGREIPARAVMARRDLEVVTNTYPRGVASKVELFWRELDASTHGTTMSVEHEGSGPWGNNTRWRATIPGSALHDGGVIEYWIRAEGPDGEVLWESDEGRNFKLAPTEQLMLWNGGAPELWQHAGRGDFAVHGDRLVAQPNGGLGLFWATVPIPADFELALEFQLSSPHDNSGVFLRFRDPEGFGYENTAWVAVHDGLEVQIDELARPDGASHHRTGAFYEIPGQTIEPAPSIPAGQWNEYVIRAEGQLLTVHLNGTRVSTLNYAGDPSRPLRGQPSSPGMPRFVGLQSHTGEVAYRKIRLRSL